MTKLRKPFCYIRPSTEKVDDMLQAVSDAFAILHGWLEENLTAGPDLLSCGYRLEEAFHWACRAVLVNQDEYEEPEEEEEESLEGEDEEE